MKVNLNTILLGALLIVGGYIAFSGSLGGDKDVKTKDAKVSLKGGDNGAQSNLDATKGTTTSQNPNFDPDAPLAALTLAETEFDFGTINDGDKVSHTFEFTNTGDNPLIISNAKGSCGCTVPTWPKEPIAPGETSSIEVEFDSKNKPGAQNKTVTITANTEPAQTFLKVKAQVNPATPAQ